VLFALPVFAQLTGFPAAERISRENRPRLDSLAGNGIDTGTGAFLSEQSLLLLQGVRPLAFTLRYNSLLTSADGVLGRGWSHEYEGYLDGDPAGVMTVHWDLNRKNSFRFVSDGQPYEPLDEAVTYDQLRRNGENWVLTIRDGTVYRFDSSGYLRFMENRVGQPITVVREDGRVAEVDEGSGKRIELHYNQSGTRLQHLEDSADRLVYFAYDAGGMLAAIRGPATQGLVQGASFSSPRNIPDGGTLTVTTNVTDSGPMGLLRFADMSISHPRLSDIVVRLQSPQGTTVQLAPNQTGGLWTLTSTVLDDFDGEDPRGVWTLTVLDTRAGQTGSLNNWRMRFTEQANSIFYSNDTGGRIIEAFDSAGRRFFANGYDLQGRIVLQDDGRADNAIATLTYEETAAGVRTVYKDRAGAETILEHDPDYRLTAVTDPLGGRASYGYNARGDRTEIRDALGRTSRLEFSGGGELLSYTDPAGAAWAFEHSNGDVTVIQDPLGKRTEMEYQSHKLTRVKDAVCLANPACAGVRKTYGGSGELLSNLLSDGGGINYTWQSGRPVGATRPSGDGKETAEYDEAGRILVNRDAGGFATHYTYNSASQVLTQTDPLGLVTSREYDTRGQVIRSTDPRGDTSTFAYDGNGNLISRTDPLGETTRFIYDGEDRLKRTENAAGHGSTLEFDAAGRVTRQTDDAGVSLRFEYDAVGNRTATYDSNNVPIEKTTYDTRDLAVAVTDAYGNRTVTQYDDLARPVSVKDALGQAETLIYDPADRLKTHLDRLARTATQSYAADGVVSSITNAKGEALEFGYDLANRMTSIKSAGGEEASFGYNNRDLQSYEQFGGVVHEYLYDDAGRLTRIERHNGEVIEYDLDSNGNITTVRARYPGETDLTVRLRFDYDALNRITRFQDHDGNVLRYRYNSAGRIETLTYPDGKQVRYSYDAGERLAEIVDWAGRHTRYTYDANGNPSKVQLPNGVVQQMTYDKGGRLVRRTDRSGTVLVDIRYTFDPLNRLADVRMTPSPPAYVPEPVAMTYGAGGRLANFNGAGVQYNDRGALTLGPLGDSVEQFAYDQSGNLSRAGARNYTYNEFDQLIRLDGPEGATRLVVNPVPGLPQVLVRNSPAGVTRYVWGPGLVYEESGGNIRTYHYDFAGNTIALAGESGEIVGTLSYGPYGEIAAQTGSIDTPFQYGGVFGVITDTNGLISMQYRWYSPQLRRFLTEDSEIGRPGAAETLNRYAYGGLNPISYADPSGRFLNTLFGAVAGAVVNVAARTVVSLVTRGQLPSPGEVAGAALEGAIVGALLGTCGPGCGVVASAGIGGFGAASGSLTQQLIDDQRVDPAQLGVDTGFGVLFGGVGAIGGAGKGARAAATAPRGAGPARPGSFLRPKSISPNGATKSARNLLAPPARSSVILRPKSGVPMPSVLARLRVEVVLRRKELVKDLTVGTIETAAGDVLSNLVTAGLTPGDAGPQESARMTARSDGRSALNAGQSASFGAFRHWNTYITALALAGRSAPEPQPALGTF
jgi:RHS repeat-associated protein